MLALLRKRLSRRTLALALAATVVVVVALALPTVIGNARGVCWERGRALTAEEKKQVYFDELYDMIRSRSVSDQKSQGLSNLIGFEFRKMGIDYNFHRRLFSVAGPDTFPSTMFKVYIYPEIPSQRKGDHIDRYLGYSIHKGYISWRPIENYYKYIGYAYDFIFIFIDFNLTLDNGKTVPLTLELRRWADACGRSVDIPESRETG